MEAADTLYGVSMGNDGVSKVVSAASRARCSRSPRPRTWPELGARRGCARRRSTLKHRRSTTGQLGGREVAVALSRASAARLSGCKRATSAARAGLGYKGSDYATKCSPRRGGLHSHRIAEGMSPTRSPFTNRGSFAAAVAPERSARSRHRRLPLPDCPVPPATPAWLQHPRTTAPARPTTPRTDCRCSRGSSGSGRSRRASERAAGCGPCPAGTRA